MRPGAAFSPRTQREPVPSVPPVGKADGSPLRYGGLRAAFRPSKMACHKGYCLHPPNILLLTLIRDELISES